MQFSAIKGRLEDARLLTGQGCYVSDFHVPDQAYAFFLRADRAHAEIVSIDTSAACDLPGVLCVLTSEEMAQAGLKSLPVALPAKGIGESELLKPVRPVLAHGKVRFVGEPVVLVVADTMAIAQDAAELVLIEYNDLSAVIDATAALSANAPQLFDGVPNNQVFEYASGDAHATSAAFARAAHVVKLSVDNTRVVGNPMEPRACLAQYDAGCGDYTLHACTQGVATMRGQIAAVMDVPAEKIRIAAQDVGGGFGVRFNLYPEYCATLVAAKLLGRAVKWTGSRSEVFLADEQARDVRSTGEMALDAQGRILGMRFDFTANLGAYLCPTGPFVNTLGVVNCLSGVYDVQAVHARIRLAVTNTAPMAAYRGAGRPVMSYILERLIDEAALQLKIDPLELRQKNFIPAHAFPYTLVNGFVYDCGDFQALMQHAREAADWDGFAKRRAASLSAGRLRGRGVATFIEATGAGFAPKDQVLVRWDDRGELTLYAPTHAHGQGHETTYAQIVSAVLGVPMQSIHLKTADPDVFLLGNATGGSRSLLAVGSVLQLAAYAVVEQGKTLAAEALEVARADIEFSAGAYRIVGTDRSIRIDALARQLAGTGPHPLDLAYENKFGATYPNGCHIAEVEILPETGEAQIVSYVSCDDAGNIINHQIVEGQMQGGITQGAGQVFCEQAIYDQSGQLLTGSFMDYAMPRPGLVDGLMLIEHPVPTATNPLGAKGVGEAGVTGSLPALMNAVLDALRSQGVSHFDMPASPQRIWRALQSAKAGQPSALSVHA